MRKQRLVIMLKEPRAGRVKTRLGRDIGMTSAAWWFRHQTRRLIRQLTDPRWEIILSVAPDIALNSRAWPAHLRRLPQGLGDLGSRMRRTFDTAPAGPTLIIGGDIPGISPQHIASAFKTLGNHDMVFGPAMDGGFWLVGAKRTVPLPQKLFKNVRWSTGHALKDTLKSAGQIRIGFVATLRDVDTAKDLGRP